MLITPIHQNFDFDPFLSLIHNMSQNLSSWALLDLLFPYLGQLSLMKLISGVNYPHSSKFRFFLISITNLNHQSKIELMGIAESPISLITLISPNYHLNLQMTS